MYDNMNSVMSPMRVPLAMPPHLHPQVHPPSTARQRAAAAGGRQYSPHRANMAYPAMNAAATPPKYRFPPQQQQQQQLQTLAQAHGHAYAHQQQQQQHRQPQQQYVARNAQAQLQSAGYYSRTRANSRDRSFTDSTNQQSASRSSTGAQPRVVTRMPSPEQQYYRQQQHQQQYQQQHHQQQQRQLDQHQPVQHSNQHHQQQYQPQPQVQQQRQTPRQAPQQQAKTMQAAVSAPAPAPAVVEWRVAMDPKTKRPYYYHPVTRETSWKKPQELVEKEKRERAQFFAAMESNIRSKLRAGNWFRDSLTSRPDDLDNLDVNAIEEDDGELSSSTSTSTSSRSSWCSGSAGAVPTFAVTKYAQVKSRSMPNSPECIKPVIPVAGSNQDDNDTAADALAVAAAASKPPLLFRTLSSYETPVVGETKKLANGRMIAVPSPIQERVRLAVMDDDVPRSSDLESYTRHELGLTSSGVKSAGADATPSADTAEATAIVRQPLRRRSNSTSTIFVRMGTMNAPDQDTTIQCVATVLRAHLMEAHVAPITVDGKFEIFINRRDERADAIPSLKDIGAFMKHIFARAQMESECLIMSLIYVERLLKATMGSLQLQPSNWRSILFCSMVMASKVWDDLSMCNADFSKIWPELTLKEINELELAYLSAVEYNVRVSAVSYAKYYFHLRSMCASMGMLASFDESAPLNLEGARKMQVLSEEYQERSKLQPVPRRRSVTITTPSPNGTGGRSLAASVSTANKWSTTKSSPSASLEQLVHMQVRGAGGSALSSMHRLSLSSKP